MHDFMLISPVPLTRTRATRPPRPPCSFTLGGVRCVRSSIGRKPRRKALTIYWPEQLTEGQLQDVLTLCEAEQRVIHAKPHNAIAHEKLMHACAAYASRLAAVTHCTIVCSKRRAA